MKWDEYLATLPGADQCSPNYLRFARIRYELEQLIGDVITWNANECMDDRGIVSLLKAMLVEWSEPTVKKYCLQEIGRVYGRR